jgi:hypothetical protein
MDMEGAGLDSLEDRLAGKRTRATDASLLSPFADAVGDSLRSAKRSRPQVPVLPRHDTQHYQRHDTRPTTRHTATNALDRNLRRWAGRCMRRRRAAFFRRR